MGSFVSSYIFPHPPIIVPNVGQGREKEAATTVNAAVRAAEQISRERPGIIVLTTPHAPLFQDYIYMTDGDRIEGDFSRFGAPGLKLSCTLDAAVTARIAGLAAQAGIPAGGLEDRLMKRFNIRRELDHGAMVPLYYVMKQYSDFKLVHMSVSGMPSKDLYRFGMCIAKAVEEAGEKAVFIASGDLSHKLSDEGPYGFNPRGAEFDRLLVRSVKELDIEALLTVDEGLCESAGECGLRSFIIMFGAMDGYELEPEIYSYEGPFGVGYAIARLGAQKASSGRGLLETLERNERRKMEELRENEDPYVALARKTLELYVREGKTLQVPGGLPDDMLSKRAGTFVSIKKHGQLRGCIGTTGPTRPSVAEEIIHNAISAGTRDPRFEPIGEDELDSLVYSVDILSEPEPISSMDELDVVRYGVIVRSGYRSGLLLPNLEGVDTPRQQVSIALQKAGIRPDEDYSMERFEVVRHK